MKKCTCLQDLNRWIDVLDYQFEAYSQQMMYIGLTPKKEYFIKRNDIDRYLLKYQNCNDKLCIHDCTCNILNDTSFFAKSYYIFSNEENIKTICKFNVDIKCLPIEINKIITDYCH